MIHRRIQALSVVLAGLSLAGCPDDSDGEGSTIDCRKPLVDSCDIRKADCREAVFAATACERGQSSAKIPPVRIITRDQLRDEIEAETMEVELSREDRAWERANKLLGFLPPEANTDETSADFFVDGIAAYYSSLTKDITVIEDSASERDDGTFTLSHEFVHALQDQRDGFEEVYDDHLDSTDSLVALDSLFEGEATLLSNIVMARVFDEDPDLVDWDGYFDDMLSGILLDINSSGAPLISAIETLPYPVGGNGLVPYYLDGGKQALEDLYQAPYTTLAQWIDNDSSLQELDCAPPAAPTGYTALFGDRLGLSGLLALDVARGAGTDIIRATPSPWRSDFLVVFATAGDNPDGVALSWRVRLNNESAAGELSEAVTAFLPDAYVDVQGQELLIALAEDPSVLADWDTLTGCEKSGKSKRTRGEPLPLAASLLQKRLGIVF